MIGREGGRGAGLELVHRTSYKHNHGEIPDGWYVMHKCDNPPCFNPEHLTVGTAKDNAQDSLKKGRSYIASGEKSALAKLTNQQVAEIRSKYVPPIKRGRGYKSNAHELAIEYGITHRYVSEIIQGRWRKNG